MTSQSQYPISVRAYWALWARVKFGPRFLTAWTRFTFPGPDMGRGIPGQLNSCPGPRVSLYLDQIFTVGPDFTQARSHYQGLIIRAPPSNWPECGIYCVFFNEFLLRHKPCELVTFYLTWSCQVRSRYDLGLKCERRCRRLSHWNPYSYENKNTSTQSTALAFTLQGP